MSLNSLSAIPPYVFYELDARRSRQRAAGKFLIDVGIGSPDGPIPDVVIEAMQRAAADRALSGYPYFRAHPAYTAAVAAYVHARFGVTLDPVAELLALAGSKEGIAELILSHTNPGDVVLVPEVYYPVYARATLLAGAVPVFVPFLPDGRLDLEAVAPADLARARVLIVNYPGNPTTSTISLQDYAQLVSFAERHALLLISDLAYSELSFDGYRVPSVLQVPGANIGYGVSTLAQLAGAAAFTHHEAIVPPIVDEYRARRDALVAAMQAGGWDVQAPQATMYLWLPVPAGYDDWGWVDALLEGPGVVVTPGIAFGEAGRGRFRVSLVQPADVLTTAAAAITSIAAATPTP